MLIGAISSVIIPTNSMIMGKIGKIQQNEVDIRACRTSSSAINSKIIAKNSIDKALSGIISIVKSKMDATNSVDVTMSKRNMRKNNAKRET